MWLARPITRASISRIAKPKGSGHKDLCAVWTDPDFDKDEHSFYYARVLENPSCRWNQHYCNARGVNCEKEYGYLSYRE